jgi:hypothetical protein
MSKLKEIIHQYVVEALQEILDEEVEQIDELSLDALDNYKRKAGKRLRSLSPQYNWSPDSPVKKEIDKRVKGYRQAWQKIEDKL